jgi:P27 family predicted phage terminase small subunit
MARHGRQKRRAMLSPENRRPGAVVHLVPREELEVPDAPAGLRPESLAAWEGFWASDVARAVQRADWRRLTQWIEAVDELAAMRGVLREHGMVVSGSKGQPALNPLVSQIRYLEGVIERAEDAFGMSPAGRMRLGVDTGEQRAPAGVDALAAATREAFSRRMEQLAADPATDGFESVL